MFREYEALVIRESPTTLAAICRDVIRRRLSSESAPVDDESIEIDRVDVKIDVLPLPEKLKKFCKENQINP